ncbi:MAG: hypothetical protein ACPGSC_12405 [Granulosicoccaceae bacterium]
MINLDLTHLEIAVLAGNIILLFAAKPILSPLLKRDDAEQRNASLNAFRGLNVLILLAVGAGALLAPEQAERFWLLKLVLVLLTIYCFYLLIQISAWQLRKHYGNWRSVGEEKILTDSYKSRLLSLISTVFLAVLGLIAVIQIAGFNSLLQATGVLGFVGVFLALTQASWLPDIFSGLVLLNANMVEEGDVVLLQLHGKPTTCSVHKTKLFHTELLDVADNHRIMVSNSQLRHQPLHNLAKFASAKGLREQLHFKIGYDVPETQVRTLFDAAFAAAETDSDIQYERQHPIEVRLVDAGDHALEWMVCYYIKNVRSRLLTQQLLRETILRHSIEHNISLSTPTQLQINTPTH